MNIGSINQALQQPTMLNDYEQREADGNRWSRYRRYLDFYNGKQWEDRPRPGERRITCNYSRTFVLKTASFLFGKSGVTFSLEPLGNGPRAEATARHCEAFLRDTWQDNNLDQLDYDAAVDAAVLGDGAFKITLQDRGDFNPLELELESDAPGLNRSRIVIKNCDVMSLTAKWRGDDMRRLLSVAETWRATKIECIELYGEVAVNRAQLGPHIYDDSLVTVKEYWDADKCQIWINSQLCSEYDNPYGFIPYVIFPNLRRPRQFWGESDLVDILTLNSELNVRVSTLSQILQLSGNPILVLENVEDANGLRVGPGAVWTLPENSKAYLLDLLKDGGLNLHVAFIENLYRILHDLSEMPRVSFGDNAQSPAKSGVALEIMLQPLIQKIVRKRAIWTEVLDRRNRMILALAGLPVHKTIVQWPDILPSDRSELVNNEVALVEAGIHSRVAASQLLGDETPKNMIQSVLDEAKLFGIALQDKPLEPQRIN